MVSAVLHLDEKTPHIHAAVIPIVTGKRRKERLGKLTPSKKSYRKKDPNRPRLCADDIMSHDLLVSYQDTYAERMSTFGLKRGVRGSEAYHISTRDYYRQVFAQGQELEKENTQVAEEIRKKRQELAGLISNMMSLENRDNIKILEKRLKDMEEWYLKELEKQSGMIEAMRREISQREYLFPFHGMFSKMAGKIMDMGFADERLRDLFAFIPVSFTGKLYSQDYGEEVQAQDALLQLRFLPEQARLDLLIDGIPHREWFRRTLGLKEADKREISPGVKV